MAIGIPIGFENGEKNSWPIPLWPDTCMGIRTLLI
jgi:hypothetical protein